MPQPVRVSSYWTLMLKIFVPTTWIVFFGALVVFATILNGLGNISFNPVAKLIIVGFYIIGLLLLYISFMQLKRVELDEEFFYVTNYFKTFRYTYDSLAEVKELDWLVMHIVVFNFTRKSAFGKKVYFIQRRKVWQEYVREHPQVFAHLADPD